MLFVEICREMADNREAAARDVAGGRDIAMRTGDVTLGLMRESGRSSN